MDGARLSELPSRGSLHPGVRAGLGGLAGFALVAVTNAVAIAAGIRWPAGGARVRLLHHAFDAAGVLGLGILAGLAVGLGTAIVERPAGAAGAGAAGAGAAGADTAEGGAGARARRAVGLLVLAGVAGAIMDEIVGRDLRRQALVLFGGRLERAVLVFYLALCGTGVAVAHALGTFLSRVRPLWLRLAPLALALAGLVANQLIARDDYHGAHGAIAWSAATLAGAGCAPLVEAFVRRRSRREVILGGAAIGVAGALGLAVPPPNAIRVELFRLPSAISTWALAQIVWTSPGPHPAAPPRGEAAAGAPDSPWWRDRRALPPIPPTAPPLGKGKPPVVVLLTIDAVRADAFADPQSDRRFPSIAAMKRSGAFFTRATSPGSQTAVSLSTVFSGRYFSQLVWAHHGRGPTRFPYPAADPARRFPELLADRGVLTASFCPINFLAGEFGVTRGFAEETIVSKGRSHAMAAEVMTPLLARLRQVGDEPAFLYAHLMEPHAPYDRGGVSGTSRERYLAEIKLADRQIGQLSRLLAQRFPDRGYLIVTSDHGEAFGEHGTREHTKTIYEELLRVPLLIQGPGVPARRLAQHVGLVDLGPTILDLFGVETPPELMGQSLLPLLAGRDRALDRPLLAEGRLRRALYWGDLKIIDDPRRKLVEAYDLRQDPGEERNLFGVDPARVDPALAALRAFFAAHRPDKPGYVPIYKP